MDDPSMEMADAAWMFLRRCHGGSLHFDEHIRPIRYVFAPDGCLVSPVMVAMLEAVDCVLFVPDEEEGCMELMVSLDEMAPTGQHEHLADRWRIYHGDPPDVRWAIMSIDAARYAGYIVDGAGLMRRNALESIEARVCREVNSAHLDTLRAALRQRGLEPEDPRLVGLDQAGFDVRGTFTIHRLPISAPMNTPEEALAALQALAGA